MLERRVRSGMEVVDFTGVVLVYSWRGGRGYRMDRTYASV
jgi:hypothetical protein